jgi:hypothetical protein
LPGERIEKPLAVRIGGQVDVIVQGQHVDRRGADQRVSRLPQQDPQHRGEQQKQYDIERQHVHVDGPKLQEHRLEDGDVGLFEEPEDVHFLRVERIAESRRHVGDLGHEHREKKDVRHVDLPGPAQDAGAGDNEAALAHGPAVDEGGGIA